MSNSPTAASGDFVNGDKVIYQHAGADIVGRDKIINQAAPPIGIAALHQLPSPPRDFTGRAAELGELRQAIREQGASISGLRGLGGIGKTALALVLAHELAVDYPDAQIFIDLQGVTKPLRPETVTAHIIRAFQPVAELPEDAAQLSGIYHTVLSKQRVLLLLDNASDSTQIKPLIPPPGCLLIVTSRTRFSLAGLYSLNLGELMPADAEALLLKRAPRIGERAAELARLCGYLPQALALVGGALAEREDLDPAAYAKRLEQMRLKALDEIEASLTLSYNSLSSELQGLWRLLAVFPGDFVGFSAAAVWGLDPDQSSDRLGDLLRYSVLEYDAKSRRYHQHDLARDFARARQDEAERDDAARHHAAHYSDLLAYASALYLHGNEDILRGLALFDLERANIIAAQTWAMARAGDDDTAARLVSSNASPGTFLALRQLPRERIAWLEVALLAARRIKDRGAEGRHLGNLGAAYRDLGEPHRAIEYTNQQLEIAREIGDRHAEANALSSLGIAYTHLGEPHQAIEFHNQALAIDREIANRSGEGIDLVNLGVAYGALGELRRAIEFFKQQLEIAREVGDRREEASALGNLGVAYEELDEPRRAIGYYGQILVLHRQMGDRSGEGKDLGNLGNAYARLGQPRRAIDYYEQRLTIAREIGDWRGEGNALVNMARAYSALGDQHGAIDHYKLALAILHEIGDRRGESLAAWNLGLAYQKLGDLTAAVDSMQRRVDYAREHGLPTADKEAAIVEVLRAQITSRG